MVASVVARILAVPLPSFMHGFGYQSVNMPFVEIYDSNGVVGTGFTYTLDIGATVVKTMVDDVIAPALIGRPLSDWEEGKRTIIALTRRLGATAFTAALSAVDIAIWDLRAKLAGEPLYQLLGGVSRAVPLYGSGRSGQGFSTTELIELSLGYVEDGFAGVKIAIGAHPIDVDVARVTAVREALPEHIPVMVDGSERYSYAQALEFACKASHLGLLWFEEPMLAEKVFEYRQLAQTSPIPIATGEHFQGLAQLQRYLAETGIAFYQPDAALGGGIDVMLEMARAIGRQPEIAIGWHSLGDLHAHLASAVPATTWLEDFPIFERVIASPLRPIAGKVSPPERPGHGIIWDEDALAAYTLTSCPKSVGKLTTTRSRK
jgi:L-alanine-DL-glutamate epimerase-like enolase superfamily enzyme